MGLNVEEHLEQIHFVSANGGNVQTQDVSMVLDLHQLESKFSVHEMPPPPLPFKPFNNNIAI